MKKVWMLQVFGVLLIVLSVISFIYCSDYADKSFDKYERYYHSENYSSLNKNAYVGGDAYNYIINGTYFTAFAVYSVGFGIGGAIFLTMGLLLIGLGVSYNQTSAEYWALLQEIKQGIKDAALNAAPPREDDIPEI